MIVNLDKYLINYSHNIMFSLQKQKRNRDDSLSESESKKGPSGILPELQKKLGETFGNRTFLEYFQM